MSLHTLSRRGLLGLCAGALLWGADHGEPEMEVERPSERHLILVNSNTKESFEGVYFRDGDYDPEALQRLNVLLRDHKAEKVGEFDPKLFDLFHDLRQGLACDGPIEVCSAYRSPATNAQARRRSRLVAKNSLHMKAMAADIRIPGHSVMQMRQLARSLKAGGVGTYRGKSFIHVDVGPIRYW